MKSIPNKQPEKKTKVVRKKTPVPATQVPQRIKNRNPDSMNWKLDNRIDGVVSTFADITAAKTRRQSCAQRRRARRANSRIIPTSTTIAKRQES
jgi:hypothetical protein